MGDAVAGFRPHTAGNTSQAAFHSLELDKSLRAEKFDWCSFERDVKRYARKARNSTWKSEPISEA